MGVDYTGNYGVGVQVKRKEFDESSEYYDNFYSYLDDILDGTDYYYFEVGEGMYTGEENEVYVCISKPFKDGYDIVKKSFDLYCFLRKKK